MHCDAKDARFGSRGDNGHRAEYHKPHSPVMNECLGKLQHWDQFREELGCGEPKVTVPHGGC
eukprot:23174-Eustigmatos_ZCMA.PRE.1